MKKIFLFFVAYAAQISHAQQASAVGSLTIINDGVHHTMFNSGNVSKMYMGFDGATGYVNFGTHTGNGFRDDILYMRGIDGNVGIGTANPSQKLEVLGNGLFQGAAISSIPGDIGGQLRLMNPSKTTNGTANNWVLYNMTGGYGNSLQFWVYDNLGCGTGLCTNRFTIMDNGNIGIGTINPLQKLAVSNNGAEGFEVYLDPAVSVVGLQSYNRVTNNYSKMQLDASQFSFMYGKVGIGKLNPSNELDVNGTIHSKEVKVDLNFPAPDYVFKEEYNLRPLQEVENYIKENSHLPEIPSAKEFEKNGINVSEMNMALLKKIEELTLYAIEQKKKNELQSEEIESLKKENQNFQKIFERLTKIEDQLK